MEDYTWSTEYPHIDNTQTMDEYLRDVNMLDITKVNGPYAEGMNTRGDIYAIHAGGNGDSFNHKVTFEFINNKHNLKNKQMTVEKKYVIYQLCPAMDSQTFKLLEKVTLSGWTANRFGSEDEAIEALIADDLTYEDFVILKEVYITSS